MMTATEKLQLSIGKIYRATRRIRKAKKWLGTTHAFDANAFILPNSPGKAEECGLFHPQVARGKCYSYTPIEKVKPPETGK